MPECSHTHCTESAAVTVRFHEPAGEIRHYCNQHKEDLEQLGVRFEVRDRYE